MRLTSLLSQNFSCWRITEIACCLVESVGVVPEFPQRLVACSTEDTTNLPGFVVVVNRKMSLTSSAPTYPAGSTRICQERIILVNGDTICVPKVLIVRQPPGSLLPTDVASWASPCGISVVTVYTSTTIRHCPECLCTLPLHLALGLGCGLPLCEART